jgi:uncharacterized protein YdbL (DUF1318 family)
MTGTLLTAPGVSKEGHSAHLGRTMLPAAVGEIVNAYLQAVDAEAPGLVECLYVERSAALEDFRPHTSDIDFVAVTVTSPDRRPSPPSARCWLRLLETYGL